MYLCLGSLCNTQDNTTYEYGDNQILLVTDVAINKSLKKHWKLLSEKVHKKSIVQEYSINFKHKQAFLIL